MRFRMTSKTSTSLPADVSGSSWLQVAIQREWLLVTDIGVVEYGDLRLGAAFIRHFAVSEKKPPVRSQLGPNSATVFSVVVVCEFAVKHCDQDLPSVGGWTRFRDGYWLRVSVLRTGVVASWSGSPVRLPEIRQRTVPRPAVGQDLGSDALAAVAPGTDAAVASVALLVFRSESDLPTFGVMRSRTKSVDAHHLETRAQCTTDESSRGGTTCRRVLARGRARNRGHRCPRYETELF